MPTEVILPKVDMDMATGQIARWFAGEGDTVKKGDPLFEIETDKAAMEVDAPASGVLREVTGREGVDIPVGQAVAWIYAEGEAARAPEASAVPVPAADAPGADSRQPGEREVTALTGTSTAEVSATGTNGAAGSRVRATPLARRLARENGIDLSALTGSGPRGRIQREDVEGRAKDAPAAPPAAVAARPAPAPVAEARATPAPVEAPRLAAPRSDAARGPLHAEWLRRGEGVPVVLIHGFGSETASWRPFLPAFARDVGILALDLPGHGGSVDAAARAFGELVAAVEETLAAEGLAQVHLVGHSLGGAVAAAVAAGGTVAVRSLFLLAPAGLGPEIDTGFTEGFAAATEFAPLRVWMDQLVADPSVLSDGFVRATARARADGRHSAAQTGLGRALFANGTQLVSTRGLFDHLAMPVKVVVGTADRVIPSRHAFGLPGTVALHVFPGVGHMPQLERKAEVARLLDELVRSA